MKNVPMNQYSLHATQELAAFPGPLKPGVTHKNDVIKFCERKISGSRGRSDLADRESFVLLWEMLILLLRQKGQVRGEGLVDVMELLHMIGSLLPLNARNK